MPRKLSADVGGDNGGEEVKKSTAETVSFFASLPLGLFLAFWLISVHHYFIATSPLDAGYDFEADSAGFGFVFWFIIAGICLMVVDKWFKDDNGKT